MPGVGLVVVDFDATCLQEVAGLTGEGDGHDRVPPSMGHERPQALPPGQVRLPALDRGHEPGEGQGSIPVRSHKPSWNAARES